MKTIALIFGIILLIACSQQQTGLPNPASRYCEDQGGALEMRTVDGGNQGFCKLPDGTVCDEWEYYRGECPSTPGEPEPQDQYEKAVELAKKHATTLKEFVEGTDINIKKVSEEECAGCYHVELEFDVPSEDSPDQTERVSVKVGLDNWIVSDVDTEKVEVTELSPEECEAKGGTPVNTVGGATCEPEETNLGNVVGFISPNICCALIEDFDDCVNAGFPVMESYPRQCAIPGGSSFTEVLEPDIAEVLDEDCETDQDCTLPGEWAIRSVCPYEVRCLEAKCTVVCPWPGAHPG
jgi:putative hemolysin